MTLFWQCRARQSPTPNKYKHLKATLSPKGSAFKRWVIYTDSRLPAKTFPKNSTSVLINAVTRTDPKLFIKRIRNKPIKVIAHSDAFRWFGPPDMIKEWDMLVRTFNKHRYEVSLKVPAQLLVPYKPSFLQFYLVSRNGQLSFLTTSLPLQLISLTLSPSSNAF